METFSKKTRIGTSLFFVVRIIFIYYLCIITLLIIHIVSIGTCPLFVFLFKTWSLLYYKLFFCIVQWSLFVHFDIFKKKYIENISIINEMFHAWSILVFIIINLSWMYNLFSWCSLHSAILKKNCVFYCIIHNSYLFHGF